VAVASKIVIKARARRAVTAGKRAVQLEWFSDFVSERITLSMMERVKLASILVQSRVIHNISIPVVSKITSTGKRRVIARSKPGEYPRAETTNLLKNIFLEVERVGRWSCEGRIGTKVNYGIILERSDRLRRKYLVKTLNEQRARVMKILTGPLAELKGKP